MLQLKNTNELFVFCLVFNYFSACEDNSCSLASHVAFILLCSLLYIRDREWRLGSDLNVTHLMPTPPKKTLSVMSPYSSCGSSCSLAVLQIPSRLLPSNSSCLARPQSSVSTRSINSIVRKQWGLFILTWMDMRGVSTSTEKVTLCAVCFQDPLVWRASSPSALENSKQPEWHIVAYCYSCISERVHFTLRTVCQVCFNWNWNTQLQSDAQCGLNIQ